MSKLKKRIFILIIILVMILSLIIPNLGNWIVSEDELTESDIIVVLMGSVSERILEAVDLYQEGLSDKIIFVNDYMSGKDVLLDEGVEIPDLYVRK